MATIAHTKRYLGDGWYEWKWTNITEADTGEAVVDPDLSEVTVQIGLTGGNVFGGGSIAFEGSLNGTDYVTLNDKQGAAISVSAAALKAVEEHVTHYRPGSPGGVSVDLDVIMIAKTTKT